MPGSSPQPHTACLAQPCAAARAFGPLPSTWLPLPLLQTQAQAAHYSTPVAAAAAVAAAVADGEGGDGGDAKLGYLKTGPPACQRSQAPWVR
eukprot:scaffold38347_cov19-Tisochrysis_lutea.AAC.1